MDGIKFNKTRASFILLDRDDGVFIPGEVNAEGFISQEVEFQEGLSWDNVTDDDVALLQRNDGSASRFIRMTGDDFYGQFDKWQALGWDPIGMGLCRYFPTLQDYLAALEE